MSAEDNKDRIRQWIAFANFDIFKIKDGKVVEHWDVLQEEVPVSATASSNLMFSPE